jgi:hypothetical protein
MKIPPLSSASTLAGVSDGGLSVVVAITKSVT